MEVEVAVPGFPSLIILMVSVDVKQRLKKKKQDTHRGVDSITQNSLLSSTLQERPHTHTRTRTHARTHTQKHHTQQKPLFDNNYY